MSNWIERLLASPVLEEKARIAWILNVTLWAILVIILAAAYPLIRFNETPEETVSSALMVGVFVVLVSGLILLARLGYVRLTSTLLPAIILIAINALLLFFGGLRTVGVSGYLLVIFLAGLILGGRAALIYGALSILSAVGIFYAYYTSPPALEGILSERTSLGFDDLFMLLAFAGLMAVLVGLTLRSLTGALDHARYDERALAESNRELEVNRDELQARTEALERRTLQLRAAVEVTHDITAARELDDLLNRAVNLIRERFGFYHAGIFLVDERGEYAVLRTATGEAGRRMLAQGHRLKVGETGIVGNVTATGEPRIALDVGTDAVHFKNPLLPETRSEMALPLRIGMQVIGALDVQSREAAAFDEDDIAILQTMADELAVAIQNAQLLSQMQQTVRELEMASGRYTQEAWQVGVERPRGYTYRWLGVEPSNEQPPEAQEVWEQGEPKLFTARPQVEGEASGSMNTAAIPIKFREGVIGVVTLRSADGDISARTVSQVEEVADRLALALENARLVEETQQRASREETLSQMTARFTQSLDLDTLLRAAVRELGQLPRVAEVSVHVGTPTGSPATDGASEEALTEGEA
jgi:GAF domain-containing protein